MMLLVEPQGMPCPPRLSATGCTPVSISQSSFHDAFESCPCVECSLCLLLMGLSNKEGDEPPVPAFKKAEEFFHPQAQKFVC